MPPIRPPGNSITTRTAPTSSGSTTIPEGKAGEIIDRYVDVMADAGVTVLLCNTNARRTNYRSRVWEAFWDGYDPAGPDDQPFLAADAGATTVAAYRKGIGNMLAVHRQGIDYPARVVQRCRQRGHLAVDLAADERLPLQRHRRTTPSTAASGRRTRSSGGRTARATSPRAWTTPTRRSAIYYKALIVETLDRYDIDGLELDFMREPYLFSAGKEAEGAPILTAWIREVRKLTDGGRRPAGTSRAARRPRALAAGDRRRRWAWTRSAGPRRG